MVVGLVARSPRQGLVPCTKAGGPLGRRPSVLANGDSKCAAAFGIFAWVGLRGFSPSFAAWCPVEVPRLTAAKLGGRAGLSPATATETLHLEVKANYNRGLGGQLGFVDQQLNQKKKSKGCRYLPCVT